MEEGIESTLPFGHLAIVRSLVFHPAVNKCELLFWLEQPHKDLHQLRGYGG